jgi:hypothetical protein
MNVEQLTRELRVDIDDAVSNWPTTTPDRLRRRSRNRTTGRAVGASLALVVVVGSFVALRSPHSGSVNVAAPGGYRVLHVSDNGSVFDVDANGSPAQEIFHSNYDPARDPSDPGTYKPYPRSAVAMGHTVVVETCCTPPDDSALQTLDGRNLAHVPYTGTWSPSPDGTKIALAAGQQGGDPRQVDLVDVATGQTRVLMPEGTGAQHVYWIYDVAWNSDGTRVTALVVFGDSADGPGAAMQRVELDASTGAVLAHTAASAAEAQQALSGNAGLVTSIVAGTNSASSQPTVPVVLSPPPARK